MTATVNDPAADLSAPASAPADRTMTRLERRSSLSLALIFALRMLGLFLVVPVFVLEARHLPGGDDPALVGLAMGMYGLTQAFLQMPFGMASDRFGRKRVMVIGLLLFAAGSFVAALAPTLQAVAVGRALQGSGAISAAVSALLADQTRDSVRTKAMALIGASIGLMFALSLVLAPVLNAALGLHGIFALTGVLALAGVAVVVWWVPPEQGTPPAPGRAGLLLALRDPALLRLNFGVFVLHAVQLSMWMAVPLMLEHAGLPKPQHWTVYLPAVLGSFVLMGATLFPLERRGHLRPVFLAAVALVALVQLALLALAQATPSVLQLALVLFFFFWGFNILEATQPSLVSRLAPATARGTALGIYNTLQSLGLFTGGAMGGWLLKTVGAGGLFTAGTVAMLVWLVVAWPMQAPSMARAATAPKAG